jgi:hypothetical protein
MKSEEHRASRISKRKSNQSNRINKYHFEIEDLQGQSSGK